MAVVNFSSIFLGTIPADERKMLTAILEHYKSKGYTKVHMPCAGMFASVRCAIEAGFAPEHIYAGDVSLFSSVLGLLYSGQPIELCNFKWVDTSFEERYNRSETDAEKVAWIMLAIKLSQINTAVYYHRTYYDEIVRKVDVYHRKLAELLDRHRQVYKGLNFRIGDVRDYFDEDFVAANVTEDSVVMFDPPTYSGGYEKMFTLDKYIDFTWPFSEFDFGKEMADCYHKAESYNAAYLLVSSRQTFDLFKPEQVVYVIEKSKTACDFAVTTRPELLEDFKGFRISKLYKDRNVPQPILYPIYPQDRLVQPEDKIQIIPLTKESSLYYRDLWVHRLGATVSEVYLGLFINGMIFATAAFNTSFLQRMQENYIFLSYCVGVDHTVYRNFNRLALRALLSADFKKFFRGYMFKNAPYCELLTTRTICLSKQRRAKLQTGLYQLLEKEKLENGQYRIVYEQPFENWTYEKCIQDFLAEAQERDGSSKDNDFNE